MENAAHLFDIHDIWVFPQHQPVCFPLREHIGCLHLEPPLSDQPPCLCFFSTAAVSIGCAIYFSFPGWGDLQAAVDRVIAPARRRAVRARAPPESLGGREEGSLSASTLLAAGVPNPAYSARRSLRRASRRRGGARLYRSGAAFVPANGLCGFQGAKKVLLITVTNMRDLFRLF